jgi:hypothetical protein
MIEVRVVLVMMVALLLAACGDGEPAGGPATGSAAAPGGEAALRVITQIGEQCPHLPLTPDPRCDPRPRPDTAFRVHSAAGELVREDRSGADGRATIAVRAGIYVVRGEPVAGYQFTPERRVTVSAGATALVPLTYTTGIQ